MANAALRSQRGPDLLFLLSAVVAHRVLHAHQSARMLGDVLPGPWLRIFLPRVELRVTGFASLAVTGHFRLEPVIRIVRVMLVVVRTAHVGAGMVRVV